MKYCKGKNCEESTWSEFDDGLCDNCWKKAEKLKNEPLKCVAEGCEELQDCEGEYCGECFEALDNKKFKLDKGTLIKIKSIVDFSSEENIEKNIIELVACELFYNHHKDDCYFIQDKVNNCSCGLLTK